MDRVRSVDRLALYLVVLAALLIRLAPLLRAGSSWAMSNAADATGYLQLADGLWSGCGFARYVNGVCSAPEIFRTPGYPAFLALMPGIRTAIAVQAIAGAALCLILGLFVSRRWGSRAGLIAASLLAADVPSIVYSAQLMTEALCQFFIALAILALLSVIEREGKSLRSTILTLAGGGLFALAVLIRPIAEFVLPLLPVAIVLGIPNASWNRRITLAGLAFAIPAAVVAGWTLRNARVAGIPEFSVVGDVNLYLYRIPGVLWWTQGGSYDAIQAELWNAPELRGKLKVSGPAQWPSRATFAEMRRKSVRIILEHPFAFAAMMAKSFAYLFVAPTRTALALVIASSGGSQNPTTAAVTRITKSVAELVTSPLLTALIVFQLALTAALWFGIARAVLRLRNWRGALWIAFPLATGFLLVLLASGAESESRMRVPALPLLAMVAAVGLSGADADYRALPQPIA